MVNHKFTWSHQVSVPLSILRSKKLTSGEKVALSIVASLPENWVFSVKGVLQFFGEGRDAVYAIFASLERKGFLIKSFTVGGGCFYTFHESPIEVNNSLNFSGKNVNSRLPEKPDAEKPYLSKNNKLQSSKEQPPSVLKTCIIQPIARARPLEVESAKAVSIDDQVINFRFELNEYQVSYPGQYPLPFYNKFFRYYKQVKRPGVIGRFYYKSFDLSAKLAEWWADTKPEIKRNWWASHVENL